MTNLGIVSLSNYSVSLGMQKLLITGANGFVGNYLCAELAPHFKVVATGKGERRLFFAHPHLSYRALDITSPEEVAALIREESPDIIVHSAAMSKPDDCEADHDQADLVNVDATQWLLETAAEVGAFFIFLSTDFIFAGERVNYREEDEPGPVNYYGQTKLEAEALVQNFPGPWSIVRTVLVYGDPKSGRQNILTTVAQALKKGETVKIFDDQLRTPTYVEDLAKAIKAIALGKRTGVFHISGKDVLSPYQMAIAVARHLGLDETLVQPVKAADMSQPARRPPITGFDLSKAGKVLGYEPVSFQEGLKLTFPH